MSEDHVDKLRRLLVFDPVSDIAMYMQSMKDQLKLYYDKFGWLEKKDD